MGQLAANPSFWAMMGQLGGAGLSAMFAPEGQELSSFEGEGQIDPVNQLGKIDDMLSGLSTMLANRLNEPVELGQSTVVQQPGRYSGGGLPFTIGLTSQDVALDTFADPSRNPLSRRPFYDRTNPGESTRDDIILPDGTRIPRLGPNRPQRGGGDDLDDPYYGTKPNPYPGGEYTPPGSSTPTPPPSAPRSPVPGNNQTTSLQYEPLAPANMNGLPTVGMSGGDDMNQALGAARLLMDSVMPKVSLPQRRTAAPRRRSAYA